MARTVQGRRGTADGVAARTEHDERCLYVAVDLVVFAAREESLQVLVIERGIPPFLGQPALPGGFVRAGESVEEAAARELAEETGLVAANLRTEQLATYSAPERDPRGRIISVAYVAVAHEPPAPTAGTDARAAWWRPVSEVRGTLAFDHNQIVADALERVQNKLEYTDLATAFCGPMFTIGELRRVYEVVWGVTLDPRNFSRKVLSTTGLVQATGKQRRQDLGRPAALYRKGPAEYVYPPILRQTADD